MTLNSEGNESPKQDLVDSGNLALADAMKKVLATGKNAGKSSLVLSKAKILNTVKTQKTEPLNFGIETVEGCIADSDVKKEELETKEVAKRLVSKKKRIRKQELAALGRIKPSVLDREKERPLMKIATRGVVQLFNAVREQQKIIEKKLEEVGPSITKQEKALKSIGVKSFFDVLRGNSSSSKRKSDDNVDIKEEDEAANEKEEPTWSVLRDDFMMGAKMKDWDKNNEEPAMEASSAKKLRH